MCLISSFTLCSSLWISDFFHYISSRILLLLCSISCFSCARAIFARKVATSSSRISHFCRAETALAEDLWDKLLLLDLREILLLLVPLLDVVFLSQFSNSNSLILLLISFSISSCVHVWGFRNFHKAAFSHLRSPELILMPLELSSIRSCDLPEIGIHSVELR